MAAAPPVRPPIPGGLTFQSPGHCPADAEAEGIRAVIRAVNRAANVCRAASQNGARLVAVALTTVEAATAAGSQVVGTELAGCFDRAQAVVSQAAVAAATPGLRAQITAESPLLLARTQFGWVACFFGGGERARRSLALSLLTASLCPSPKTLLPKNPRNEMAMPNVLEILQVVHLPATPLSWLDAGGAAVAYFNDVAIEAVGEFGARNMRDNLQRVAANLKEFLPAAQRPAHLSPACVNFDPRHALLKTSAVRGRADLLSSLPFFFSPRERTGFRSRTARKTQQPFKKHSRTSCLRSYSCCRARRSSPPPSRAALSSSWPPFC